MAKINKDIDIGLTALVINKQPGQTLTTKDIAEVCGCAKNAIYEIERKALRKLQSKRLLKDSLY